MDIIQEGSEIFVIPNFLSSGECDALILRSESLGYEDARIDLGGTQRMLKEVRNNERVLFKDEEYAARLWTRLKEDIKATIGNSRAKGLNELFRFYKYKPEQRFKMHRDGSYVRNETEFSYYTFLIYLNDDFSGGETKFESGAVVKPQKGAALIFEHSLLHEGAVVESGIKYVLRTDVMYQFMGND